MIGDDADIIASCRALLRQHTQPYNVLLARVYYDAIVNECQCETRFR